MSKASRRLRLRLWAEKDGTVMGRWKARGKAMIVASCRAEVYLGPRLWTGEPANWNSIARASAEDLDLIHPRFYSIWFHHRGASRAFSLHMAISHTLAFCPRRVAHLCPLGAQSAEALRTPRDSDEVLRKPLMVLFHASHLGLDPHPTSPQLFTHSYTDTHTSLPPRLKIYW